MAAAHYGFSGAARLDAWRAERLTEVVRHVRANSPFYGRHLAGVDPAAVTPATLHRLPFTTKDDLRREMYEVLSGPLSQARVHYETNGTTGPATPCPRSALEVATSNTAVEASLRHLVGAHFGDRSPVVGLMGPSELYAFGDVFGEVTGALGLCHVKIWPESPRVGYRKALRLIDELGVEVLVCAPALCLELAAAAARLGRDVAELPVRLFLVLGEICTPEFAANVATVWPRAVVRPVLYGSQEALCVATGSEAGTLHLAAPNYFPELVDPDTGEPVPEGEDTGELVLTMLVPGSKPLIRYRTGDVVRLSPAPAGAALPGPLVEVVGRAADRVEVNGRRVWPAELESAVLRGVRGCLGYQVVLDRDADGDTVTARIRLRHGAPREPAVAAAERLAGVTGTRSSVDLVDEIDGVTHTGAYVSWKAARVLDNRSEPDAAARAARTAADRRAAAL
ncbi:phenylacetate--CoA ligase family protein [Streptomyces sp. ventii]|uniref:Phenylacetate--CoA ligase family protein n=2 Tax=Streptomyces spiramenti TaxID=2720606 RepID=A0ABX1AN95_9ACTN|nr:AMP-binding protein [Streptomyces spiramenti]NJP65942.1 phenylacetate--CoA ligase family protein [Streptomyces spiramenti]